MSVGGDSGGTSDSRRVEADKLLDRITPFDDRLTERELDFVQECADPHRVISSRMIFWLRDIADKVEER